MDPCLARPVQSFTTRLQLHASNTSSNCLNMSRSTDPGHFFQTDASESTRARRAAKSGNKNGNPLNLQSKILNAIPDPLSTASIYIAESAGCVRKVNVEVGTVNHMKAKQQPADATFQNRDSKTVYRGPTAPITSVAVGGRGGTTVLAGCWDKDIWSWDRETRSTGRKYKGHSDFVKAIVCATIGGKDASSSRARIQAWC